MKSSILLLLLAFSLNVNSQQKTIVKKHVTFNKKINSSNEKLKSFIPKGYEAIAEKKR